MSIGLPLENCSTILDFSIIPFTSQTKKVQWLTLDLNQGPSAPIASAIPPS